VEADLRVRLKVEQAAAIRNAEERGRAAGHKEAEAAMQAELEQSRLRLTRRERRLQEQMESRTAALEGLLTSHAATVREEIQGIWQDIGELALGLASGVVRWTVDHDPELVGRVLTACIAELSEPASRVEARVHPQDGRTLREIGVEQLAGFDLTLVDDPEIERGGCLIETTGQILDGRLRRQLERLGEALAEAVVATDADSFSSVANTAESIGPVSATAAMHGDSGNGENGGGEDDSRDGTSSGDRQDVAADSDPASSSTPGRDTEADA
jgi:flagellar assembly protein FliH